VISLFFSVNFATFRENRDDWPQRTGTFPPSFHPPKQSLAISRRRLILETSGIARKLGAGRLKSVPTILIRRQTCSSANR
jgi:hypothetical protein